MFVERNPLRANKRLAAREAEPSAAESTADDEQVPPGAAELLDEWPVPEPVDWLERVNKADTPAKLDALRRCVRRGRPYGDDAWVMRTAERLGLAASLRSTGRPPKKGKPASN